MEEENIYQQEILTDEDPGPILPDGYADGDDFFEPDTWTGEKGTEGATGSSAETADEGSPDETATEEAPAIEQTEEPVPADDGTEAGAPATSPETTVPTKRRVRYQFNHEEREEEIDDADLPELLQKARSVDRYKDRLNEAQSLRSRLDTISKALKYDSGEAFLDAVLDNAMTTERESLRGQGVPDEMAEDYVSRKYSEAEAARTAKVEAEQPRQTPQAATPAERDYKAEALELLRARPALVGTKLPDEVYVLANEPGKTLLSAYTEYESKAAQAEAERARRDAEAAKTDAAKLRKENRILKNNADSADRAPVTGVSKGGRTDDKDADDPFLKGFNSMF